MNGGEKGLKRCAMPPISRPTNIAGEIYESYRQGAYIQNYESQCGESDTYDDSTVGKNFFEYIPDWLEKKLRTSGKLPAADILRHPNLGNAIFRDFLSNGRNCHESSPTRQAIARAEQRATMLTETIKKSKDNFEQYQTWRRYFDSFVDFANEISDYVRQALKNPNSEGPPHKNIRRAIALFEPLAEGIDKEIRDSQFRQSVAKQLMAIIDVQMAATRDIRMIALTLRSENERVINGGGLNIAQMYENFLELMFDFDDPFLRVKKIYGQIDWAEKLRLDDTPKDTGIIISLSGDHPILDLDDPRTFRDFLDLLVFTAAITGTDADPIKLEFSWDEILGAMIATTDSLDVLKNHAAWPDVSALLSKLNGKVEGNRIIIPLQTGAGIAGPGEIEGPTHPETNPTNTEGTEPKSAAPAHEDSILKYVAAHDASVVFNPAFDSGTAFMPAGVMGKGAETFVAP